MKKKTKNKYTVEYLLNKIVAWFKRKPPTFNKKNLKAFHTAKFKTETRALKIIDIITYIFVLTNIQQLATVFGKGEIGLVAFCKGLGFAMAEIFLCRATGRALAAKRKSGFLWFCLTLILILTVGFNLIYDWYLLQYGAPFDKGLINIDFVVLFLAIGGSGMTGLIILGLSVMRNHQEIIVQQTLATLVDYDKGFKKKSSAAERQAAYRARKKAELKRAGLG